MSDATPAAPLTRTPLTEHARIAIPLLCGAMYPCSNPELVAAASAAGGMGIVQPVSMTYVHGHDFRKGLQLIRSITPNPIGMNALIEASSRSYHQRMERWVATALEEGVRFFVTSLGNPRWVVERVHAAGGAVYHDVTERKWALKGRDGGVDGLIGVNKRAGGHAGPMSAEELLDDVGDLGLPVVCAGGVATEAEFVAAIRMGYAGVQMGTRFIATPECRASDAYKEAILSSDEDDIVLSERITGIPVAVINTPFIKHMGLRIGPLSRWLFRQRRTKHYMRSFYALRSLWQLKRASLDAGSQEYWQAGKSVAAIHTVEPAADIVRRFGAALARGG